MTSELLALSIAKDKMYRKCALHVCALHVCIYEK